MRLTSTAFEPGAEIPLLHTCDGADVSPALAWDGAPDSTRSYALIVNDPDAPAGDWVHWVIFNLPGAAHALPSGVASDPDLPSGARQGRNDFGRVGYGGPCPPRGPAHHYHFTVYALDSSLDVRAGVTRAEVESAMRTHVLGKAQLVGRFQRSPGAKR